MSKKTTVILLTLFLGGIGVHKFYLKENLQGLLYLLFCWTYIPSLIALMEFFIYFSKPEEYFERTS